MDVSGIAGAGKSHLLKQVEKATIAVGKTITILSPTDASAKDLRKAGFQARTFQGFQLRPESADLIVIDEASMLSIPQMLWLVKHAQKKDSSVLLVGDSAQHRSVERGDALRILEQSGTVRYVELLQTQRQRVPALKAAIEDLKRGRLENGWQKLEQHRVIKEFTDAAELRLRAVEQHLAGLRAGKTSVMICPRHEEARKVAAIVRQQLKAKGAIGAEDHAITVLRRMDLGPESYRDLLKGLKKTSPLFCPHARISRLARTGDLRRAKMQLERQLSTMGMHPIGIKSWLDSARRVTLEPNSNGRERRSSKQKEK